MAQDLEKLKSALAAILSAPDLQPRRDASGKLVTHCNEGARRVAEAMGCVEFGEPGKFTADEMFALMAANVTGLWLKVSGESASLHAQSGGLAFAAMTSADIWEAEKKAAEKRGEDSAAVPKELHGHIATIAPEPMQLSPSLAKQVPVVLNIGKADKEGKESDFFPVAGGEPAYFIWEG